MCLLTSSLPNVVHCVSYLKQTVHDSVMGLGIDPIDRTVRESVGAQNYGVNFFH